MIPSTLLHTRSTRLYFTLLLTGLLLALHPLATAQVKDWTSVNVRVEAKEQPLREVLQSLEKQVGMVFNYDQSEIDLNQKITYTFSGSLAEAFKRLGTLGGLEFRQTGNTITVRKKQTTINLAQTRMISGVVTDATDGSPLPGVTVLIKGTSRATMTNLKGEFYFKLVKENMAATMLEFRFMGMRNKEVVVGDQHKFEVSLEQNTQSLKEVIVTSSYTPEKRREEVVGSISQISGRELQVNRPIESFDKMLQGMIAGVQVETSTEPNRPVKMNIRGQGSLTSFGAGRTTSTQPLFVVDGVPMYEQQSGDQASVFNRENLLNPLSNINPQDIESISVLKDASASAIYGANAANGVVIITTKAGVAGKTRFNLNYSTGVSTFINQFKYLSGPQYYELLRETLINNGRPVSLAETMAGSKTIDTDWFDLMNRTGTYHNANLEASGGKENTTYRFSAGFMDQKSNAVANDLKKLTLRLRLDQKVNEKLSLGINLSPSLTHQNTLNNFGTVLLPPNISPYTEDGEYNFIAKVANPLAVLAQNEEFSQEMAFTGAATGKYNLTDAISFSGLLGSNFYSKKETQYKSSKNATGSNVGGSLKIYDRSHLGWIAFVQGMYDKTLAERHSVNFILGTQAEDNQTNLLYGGGTGFTYDRMRELSMAHNETSGSSKNSSATVSYYSQLTYDLDKKYFLNLNARSDQSSVFGGDKQVALNGSVGLGWIVTKENFLQPGKVLNHLRFRTSYGSTGNSRIGTYAARGLYNFSNVDPYNGQTSSLPDGVAAPNPALGWEKNYKFNAGVDATLFNRLHITAEVYRNTIKDLISSVNVPLETGFETISANTGTMRNQGVELTINSTNIQTPDFSWNTTFNFGLNRNKIIEFNNGLEGLYSANDAAAVTKVGISTGSIWGYEWAGVYPGTGEEYFYDRNGNLLNADAINQLPIWEGTVLGDRLPVFEGGLVNTMNYKNLTFTFNLIYSYGASFLASYTTQADGRNLDHSNMSVNLMDRWQKEGDITTVPKLYYPRKIVRNSSRYIHDLTHIKLSNVSLDYQLPEWLAKKARMQKVSVYANANNLLYWYREKSPEGRNGIAELRFIYPEMMTVVGGFRIGF